MPPETPAPTITPMPAHMSRFPLPANRWGAHLLILITLTFIFGAFFLALNSTSLDGSVTLLVRGLDGARSVESLSLTSKSTVHLDSIDPNAITTISSRTFVLSDGTVITLESAGIVRRGGGDVNVLVASPIAPFLNTPLSVWGDGAQVAWSSPADGSIQVFARSPRGAYVPHFLSHDIRPNSIGFTEDGASLIVTKIIGEETKLYAIDLDTGDMASIVTLPGFVTVVPTP